MEGITTRSFKRADGSIRKQTTPYCLECSRVHTKKRDDGSVSIHFSRALYAEIVAASRKSKRSIHAETAYLIKRGLTLKIHTKKVLRVFDELRPKPRPKTPA